MYILQDIVFDAYENQFEADHWNRKSCNISFVVQDSGSNCPLFSATPTNISMLSWCIPTLIHVTILPLLLGSVHHDMLTFTMFYMCECCIRIACMALFSISFLVTSNTPVVEVHVVYMQTAYMIECGLYMPWVSLHKYSDK